MKSPQRSSPFLIVIVAIQTVVILYLCADRIRGKNLQSSGQIPTPSAAKASLSSDKPIEPGPEINATLPIDLLSTIQERANYDIQAAIERAGSEEDPEFRRRLYQAIAKEWLKKDPDACFAWAMSLSNPNEKTSVLIAMVMSLASSGETKSAIKFINQVPIGEFKDDMIVFSFSGLFRFDSTEAMKLIDQLSGRGAIRSVAGDVVSCLAATGKLEEAKNLWTSLPHGDFRSDFATSLAFQLCKTDPGAAMDWFEANSGSGDTGDSLKRIADAFAITDGAVGMKNAEMISDPAMRQQYIKDLAVAWGRKNPSEAGKWLLMELDQTGYSANAKVASVITEEWLQWDHEAPLAAIATLSDPAIRDQMMTSALEVLSKFDPATAADKLLPLLKPESEDSLTAIGRVTSNWLVRDPLAASEWISALDRGPIKDVSINALISNILSNDKDYDMATRWVGEFASDQARAAAIEKIEKSRDETK